MIVTRTVCAEIEYDGGEFAGFQRQAATRTVQETVEDAIASVVGHAVRIVGAGRTDAGVHARGQVISTRVHTRLDDLTLLRACNARLPADVVMLSIITARDAFHARRDAIGRIYEYRILQGHCRPALDRDRGWHVPHELDIGRMADAATALVGTHDFGAFSVGPETRTTRELTDIAVCREGTVITVRVAANAFLYRMVRRLVATLVRVGRGVIDRSDVVTLLAQGDRNGAAPAAPACGLTLLEVAYPETKFRENTIELVGGVAI